MPDPRTDRIADLAEHLTALHPPRLRSARVRFDAARGQLIALTRRGAPPEVLETFRYRVERAREVLVEEWRTVARSPSCA